MKTISTYLAATLMGLSLLGCKKTAETPAPSKTDLLTNRNWITTAYTVSPGLVMNGATVTDLYAQSQTCQRDNFIRFEKPDVFINDEGATKCSQAAPQKTTGTWAFNGDNTIVSVTTQGSATPQSYTLQELTDNTLKVSYTESAGVAPVIKIYTYTITYKKG